MERAHSQEPSSDLSHSSMPPMTINQVVPSGSGGPDGGSKVKSAAMLGLALSVGASGVLLADAEASATDLSAVETTVSSTPAIPEPASLASSPEAVASQQESVYHTVEEGENLWKIAKRHQVPLQNIEAVNGISDKSLLQVGQVIKVPAEELAAEAAAHSIAALAPVDAPDAAVTVPTEASHTANEGDAVPTVTLTRIPDTIGAIPVEGVAQQPLAPVAIIAPTEASSSLESAGLTTQSDGFRQELAQHEEFVAQAPAVEASPESNIPVVTTLSPTLQERDYQVQSGDTLESIAGQLGLSSEDLAGANGLSDPDFIVAGETLVLPEQVGGAAPTETLAELGAPVVAAVTGSTEGEAVGEQRLSYLQSTAERRVNSDAILSRLRGESVEAVSQERDAPSHRSAEVAAVSDPYTASLLEQVRSARSQMAEADAEAVVTRDSDNLDTSLAAEEVVVETTVAEEASNAEFIARASVAAREMADTPDETLLAAAPLDPSAYAPAPQSNVGQVVSPDMPILPDADNYLPDAPDYFNGYVWPARGTLTSGYGPRWGRMHRGIDIAAPVGTPIVAAAPGVVERSGWNSGGYGNLVEVRHPDGSMTRYAHNSRLLVRPGQRVSQGEQIAEMGSTGYSTGPHLHFEVHVAGVGTVNPMAHLSNR